MPDARETTEPPAPGAPIGPPAPEAARLEAAAVDAALADDGSDPYYDPGDARVPLRASGHGPAHPAGKASRELGRLVASYRERHSLTQAALGERLGWPQPNVARFETGHRTPDLATLDRLARRLGLIVTVRATPEGLAVALHDAGAAPTGS